MARGYNEEIDVDMTPGGRVAVCHSSQYDVNRKIRINLYKEKSTAFLGNGAGIKLSVRKTDGTVISTDDSDVISIQYEEPSVGGRWYYVLLCTTQQMTACVGNNLCEIVVTETEDEVTSVIGSANFTLQVEKDPLDGGVESESVISDLQEQVNNAVSTALEGTKLSDLGDVDDYQGVEGNTLRFDGTSHMWKARMDVYAINKTVEAGETSFTALFFINSEAIGKDKVVRVFRDSYDGNPPTSVSVTENGMRLDVTVNLEAESSDSNWRVEVEICRSGT